MATDEFVFCGGGAGPRHLSVSHKKPTRIPGEKGSKVLRLQCPQVRPPPPFIIIIYCYY
jgi:hypothetical protein